MRIVAERMESASVVPNRTACAMRDIACILRTVENEELADEALLDRLALEFRTLCFSEVIKPLSSILDQEELEVVQIYVSTALSTFLDSQAVEVLMLTFLIIKSFEARTGTTCIIPMLLVDIEDFLTTIDLVNQSQTVTLSIAKYVARRFQPVVRKVPLYLDHSGFDNSRDNLKEFSAKKLAVGEETDRTVRVEPVGQNEVALIDTLDEETIFLLRQQTSHSSEFRKACAEIFQELENIIPPPVKADNQPDVVAMLPSRQVKALLKSGQIS